MFWPPFWVRTVGPTHWPPESCVEVSWIWDDWSLVYVSAVRMSPAVALVPSTACEAIESAPSLTATPIRPSEPSGRLKSSLPAEPVAAQVTATFVTSAAAIVPLPLATLQLWPLGFVLTVTL